MVSNLARCVFALASSSQGRGPKSIRVMTREKTSLASSRARRTDRRHISASIGSACRMPLRRRAIPESLDRARRVAASHHAWLELPRFGRQI